MVDAGQQLFIPVRDLLFLLQYHTIIHSLSAKHRRIIAQVLPLSASSIIVGGVLQYSEPGTGGMKCSTVSWAEPVLA